MQIKMDNTTLKAASASVFLFTFTVSALHNLIRQTQTHTTVVQSGRAPPSSLLSHPTSCVGKQHLCGWKNLHVWGRPALLCCHIHKRQAFSSEGKMSSQMKITPYLPIPKCTQSIHPSFFSLQAPCYPWKRHSCHFLKWKRTIQRETVKDERGCDVKPAPVGVGGSQQLHWSISELGRRRGWGGRWMGGPLSPELGYIRNQKSKKRPCPWAKQKRKDKG